MNCKELATLSHNIAVQRIASFARVVAHIHWDMKAKRFKVIYWEQSVCAKMLGEPAPGLVTTF